MDTRVASSTRHGIVEDDYANVANWATYPGFSDAERAALEFTEKFAVDHLNIDQHLMDRLLTYFSPSETVELALCIGSWLALGRVTQVFDVHVSCALRLGPGD